MIDSLAIIAKRDDVKKKLFIILIVCFILHSEGYCGDDRDHHKESSNHLEKAVEDYMWGIGEIAIGVVEVCRGDPVGGALIMADGVRNFKEAWNELQEAKEEKNLAENKGPTNDK